MLTRFLVVAISAFLAFKIYTLMVLFGFHKTIYNHHPGKCMILKEIENGSEDMETISGGKVLITSGLRLMERGTVHYAGVTGKIFVYDCNKPDLGAQRVTIKNFAEEQELDPHGISVWEDPDKGEISVFLVNHLDDSSVVELFTYNDQEMTLYHKKTFGKSDPNIRMLNDVVAVGPTQFYATNHMYTRNKAEIYLQLRWGSVVYHDGQKSQIATSEGFLLANGINMSPDGRFVYMVLMGDRELVIFTRNSDNTLKVHQRTLLYTGMDNIIVDKKTGDIWMAGHPVAYKTTEYMRDPQHGHSPSQVLRLQMKDGSVQSMTEVLMDDGKFFSGASVAVYQNNKLLVGSVATKMMVCDVTYVS